MVQLSIGIFQIGQAFLASASVLTANLSRFYRLSYEAWPQMYFPCLLSLVACNLANVPVFCFEFFLSRSRSTTNLTAIVPAGRKAAQTFFHSIGESL